MASSPMRADESADTPPFEPVTRVLSRIERRIRLQRTLDGACLGSVLALATGSVLLALHKTATASVGPSALAACASLPALGILIGALRPVSTLQAAALADRSHQLSDLLSSAWAFRHLPSLTPFMRACLRRAVASAPSIVPARAVSMRMPTGAQGLVWAGLSLLVVAALEVPAREAIAAPRPPKPRLLAQDDVAAFQDGLKELAIAKGHDRELARRAEELNELLEGLADGELERAEALERLASLTAALEEQRDEDAQALREALAELGEALDGDHAGEAVSEALERGDAKKAERALEALSQELPTREDPRDQRLAKKLERASRERETKTGEELEKRERELERLLKKKQDPKASEADQKREERLLKRKKRELDQLRREHAEQQRMRRELDQLRRELGGASRPLGQGDRRGASERLSRAARELSRMGQRQMSEEQRKRLQEQIGQLREMLKRQRQGQGGQPQAGQQGEGGQQLTVGRFGQLAQGKTGKQGDGKAGDGKPGGKPGGKMLVPGAEGEPSGLMVIPGMEGDPNATTLAEVPTSEGPGASQGGRPEEGEASRLDSEKVDVRVEGERAEGPSRAEVIREASGRGFASRGYRKVHSDYQSHAEEVLERDQVPGGYRFYVRRYFQLIRPREPSP